MNMYWFTDFPAAITICDNKGTILAMNKRSAEYYGKSQGLELIGKSLFDCHPPEACKMIEEILLEQGEKCYIAQGEDKAKLVMQLPWYQGNKFMGLVEIIKELKEDIPTRSRL